MAQNWTELSHNKHQWNNKTGNPTTAEHSQQHQLPKWVHHESFSVRQNTHTVTKVQFCIIIYHAYMLIVLILPAYMSLPPFAADV